MYDKIDIRITDTRLIEQVEKTINSSYSFEQIGNYFEYKYRLMNDKKHANAHSMMVQITQKTRGDSTAPPVLHIWGSIRKWFKGALSVDDLTRCETYLALTRLADELGISYDVFRMLPISSLEAGLNIDLGKLRCEEVKSRIGYFKDGRYECVDAKGYKSLRTGKFSAKVYDKVQEIRETIAKMPDKHGSERFERQHGRKQILRVELKAHGGPKAVEKYLGVRTVGDLVDRYHWVILKWLQNANKFGFKSANILPFMPEKYSSKEVMDYLKCRGMLDVSDVELQAIMSRLPTQARKDARNAIKGLQGKMQDAQNVRQLFRRIAKKHLVQQFNKSYQQYKEYPVAKSSPTLL